MEEIEYLYSLSRFGIKLGLENVSRFLEVLHNPHFNFKAIHIAGTNGKGSTSAMVYAILKTNYNVGLYTSPHIVDFNERIVVNGTQIEDAYIRSWIAAKRPIIEHLAAHNMQPTFFEVTTAMAFDYFREKHVDYGVVEVGLGGRLDATNVIIPEVTGIASISYDHTEKLGTNLKSIAYEKGGIIKKHIPVVVEDSHPEALSVLKMLANEKDAPYYQIDELYTPKHIIMTDTGSSFSVNGLNDRYNIFIPLPGRHQLRNALLALGIIELMHTASFTKTQIEKGFASTVWPGRFEIKSKKPLVIFDAAHNPEGAMVLADTIMQFYTKKPLFVISMLREKDSVRFFEILSNISDSVIITEIDDIRKKDISLLEKEARKFFTDVIIIKDPVRAYEYAVTHSDFVVVTGSIYLLGMIEQWLRKKRYW